MMNNTALEKYNSMIMVDQKSGKKSIEAKAILSLSWQEFAELITMHNLPQVDHVIVESIPMNSPVYWITKDLSMKQTIALWLTASALLINSSLDNPNKILPATIGFMSWVVIEYGYHRFIGHMPVTNELTKYANFNLHGKHHFGPRDLDHILLPPLFVMAVAVAVYKLLFSKITDNPELALAFAILHYLAYDVMHYAMHKFSLKEVSQVPLAGNMLARLWGNHIRHHIEPETNFSVTTGGLLKHWFMKDNTERCLSVEQSTGTLTC